MVDAMRVVILIVLCVLVPMSFRVIAPMLRESLPPVPPAPSMPGEPDGSWRRDSVWDDGKAEYSVFHATWKRYGHLFDGRVMMITVKEPWAPDLDVKADAARGDGFDVLKLNFMRDVQTGIYAYHQMASCFANRESGGVVKLATQNSEGCGISTAHLVDGELATRSYYDGQGDRTVGWPEDAVPEDGLFMLLRDYVQGVPPATLSVFPSLLNGRLPVLEPVSWTVEKSSVKDVLVPAGKFANAIEIVLRNEAVQRRYTFDAEAPYPLIRYAQEDGTLYRLAKSERIAYWKMKSPSDEAWLPEGLRR